MSEGIDKDEIRKVCTEPTCPVHHPKPHPQKVADDPRAKAQEERQRREAAIANTTGIRTLAAIAEAATAYRVDTDAIALKVKQEFAAKEKATKAAKPAAKIAKKAA